MRLNRISLVKSSRLFIRMMTFIGLFVIGTAIHAQTRAKIYDVTRVVCKSGQPPQMKRVFVPGAVLQMGQDVVEAFAKAESDRETVVLSYPIPPENLDPATPPPCSPGDTLLVELKKNQAMTAYTQKSKVDAQLPE